MSNLILPSSLSGKVAVPRHVAVAVARERRKQAADAAGASEVRRILARFETKDGKPLPPPGSVSAYREVHARVRVRASRPQEPKRRILLPGEAPSMVDGSRAVPLATSGPRRKRGNYPRP